MGHLYVPAERLINGPWFLDQSDLEELNELFETVDSKLLESRSQRIERQFLKYKDQYKSVSDDQNKKDAEERIGKYEKVVTLLSKDGKSLSDSSLKGILKDSKLIDFKPERLQLTINESFATRFSFVVPRLNEDLNYKIEHPDSSIEEELKYLVEIWIEKREPSKIKQLWSAYSSTLAFFAFFCCFISGLMISTKVKINVKDIYKKEIDSLLIKGVDQANQLKAIELLLKYNTDFNAENQREVTQFNQTPIRVFIMSFCVFIFSVFVPKTTLGIGAYKKKLKFYKTYTTFVLITLPALFVIPVIVDWIRGSF